MIGKTFSHYRIIEKIGEGGMGQVYLAEDTELHRKVALKFLPAGYASDPDVLARFKREARAAAALNHPNIITIHEVSAEGEHPFIVMAHIDGQPLRDVIHGKSLAGDRALDIAIQILEGLAKAHSADVVHRDIKPENILLDEDGRVRILDFGLAKLQGATQLTREASTLGTVYYMSPEQTRSADVDHRSDIFSAGVVLYEMLAGRVPFGGDHSSAVMYAISHETPQPLSRYSKDATAEIERIVAKALAKDCDERYQSAADMLADLKRERRISDTRLASAPADASRARPRVIKFAVPAAVVFVAALLFFIFKPFSVELKGDRPVVAAHNLLAVMYFENLADPTDSKRYGEIITNLLITDLSESSSIQVLSSQRLYDILKLKGKQGLKVLDRDTAGEVAAHAGASWMLTGSILQAEPEFILTAQLVEVRTGAIASSQRVTGETGQKVFAAVEALTREILDDLALPDGDVKVAELPKATESEEAYAHYLVGLEAENRYEHITAIAEWQAAIQLDSEFPLPHLRLAIPSVGISQADKEHHIEQAYRYRDRAPDLDRRLIEAIRHIHKGDFKVALETLSEAAERYPADKNVHYFLGMFYGMAVADMDKSIEHLTRVIEIDPLYKIAYNQLAYRHIAKDDFEKALWAIDKYIELAPDEPNPFDTRGDIYAAFGQVDKAIESYKRALQVAPDYAPSWWHLGIMYTYQGEYDRVVACSQSATESATPFRKSFYRASAVFAKSYPGHFSDALALLESLVAQDRAAGLGRWEQPILDKQYLMITLLRALGRYDDALALVEAEMPLLARGDHNDSWFDPAYVELLAESGDLTGAAEALLQFRRVVETTHSGGAIARSYLDYATGMLEREKGDYAAAIERLEAAQISTFEHDFGLPFELGRTYAAAGRHADAVAMYEPLLNRYDYARLIEAPKAVKMFYYAGVSYEATGAIDRAISNYEEFLRIWQDAEAGHEEIEDARERLKRLRHGS